MMARPRQPPGRRGQWSFQLALFALSLLATAAARANDAGAVARCLTVSGHKRASFSHSHTPYPPVVRTAPTYTIHHRRCRPTASPCPPTGPRSCAAPSTPPRVQVGGIIGTGGSSPATPVTPTRHAAASSSTAPARANSRTTPARAEALPHFRARRGAVIISICC